VGHEHVEGDQCDPDDEECEQHPCPGRPLAGWVKSILLPVVKIPLGWAIAVDDVPAMERPVLAARMRADPRSDAMVGRLPERQT